jgi:hypothetical protein
MVTIDEFLKLTETYAKALDVPLTTVSFRLFNDGKRLDMLRDDDSRDVGIRKVEGAVQYLSDNWPERTAWPKGIDRPSAAKAAVS